MGRDPSSAQPAAAKDKRPAKAFLIRDPVHGYLHVAPHERPVVDHPITQRLRRVVQTGLADLVYPEARTSRFAHSIGAMHLTSRYVVAALENAQPSVAKRFLDSIREAAGRYSLADINKLLSTDAGGVGLASARVVFRSEELRAEEDYRLMLGLVEAATRLAALFHDLGHLPFSHDFEFALRDFTELRADQWPGVASLAALPAPHEHLGHQLADLVFRHLKDTIEGITAAPFELAFDILEAEAEYGLRGTERVTALGWLHSIIDGEIDVDRADYLLRDGRALGLDFAHYDVDRLFNNLELIDDEELGYITAVREHGLSSLESFFLSRSRTHQVLVRHHKIAQAGAAFRYATAHALGRDACEPFLHDLEAITKKSVKPKAAAEFLARFSSYDDAWWITRLREADANAEPNDLLGRALALILRRERTLQSVWKRNGDLSGEQRESLNRLATKEGLARLDDARTALAQNQELIAVYRFVPYRKLKEGRFAGESILQVKTGDAVLPASRVSRVFAALDDIWQADIHLHAFQPDGASKEQAIERLVTESQQVRNPEEGPKNT